MPANIVSKDTSLAQFHEDPIRSLHEVAHRQTIQIIIIQIHRITADPGVV